MKLLPSLFGFVYSRVKIFVFAINTIGDVIPFFVLYLQIRIKNSQSEVIFAVCRLFNLSNTYVPSTYFFFTSTNLTTPTFNLLLAAIAIAF